MSIEPSTSPNSSLYYPRSTTSLNSSLLSLRLSNTDLAIPGIERIQTIRSNFQLSEVQPDQYRTVCKEVKEWKKIVKIEKNRYESFYYQRDCILEDSIFINELARFEIKHNPSGTTVWSCTRKGKLSGILLFKEKQTLLDKGNWIQATYLLSHPQNVICRLKHRDSSLKGAGEFLIKQLKLRALESPNYDGICLEPTETSKEFYRKLGFQEEASDKPIKIMFWNCLTK